MTDSIKEVEAYFAKKAQREREREKAREGRNWPNRLGPGGDEVIRILALLDQQATIRQVADQLTPDEWQFDTSLCGDQFHNGHAVRMIDFVNGGWCSYLEAPNGRLTTAIMHWLDSGGPASNWQTFLQTCTFFERRLNTTPLHGEGGPDFPVISRLFKSGAVDLQVSLHIETGVVICEMTTSGDDDAVLPASGASQ